MIKSLISNGTAKLHNSNFSNNVNSKNGIFYKYDKDSFKKLHFIKTTKLDFRCYFKCVKESFIDKEYDSFGVDYIVKKDNDYLYGNSQFIYENLNDFIGDTYTYLYQNKQYTKTFESDLVLRYIEIYCILNGIIQLINPLIEIDNTYELMKDIKSNIDTNKTYDIIGNKLISQKDKLEFCKNGKYILSILNQSNNVFSCKLDYYTLFKNTKII
mgnify:CR=1 FL=1